jgi:coenzyme F420-reducing hydrogenase alpha subunit
MHETIRRFAVDTLARVEGEGSMYLTIEDGTITDLRFKIFEPPRFFEAFLVGRDHNEAIDITARICGICPVAYQTSAANAMESILGIDLHPQLRRLRKLLYLGEWIESHGLHVYLLHAPDFLGYQDGIAMAADHPDEVLRGLRLKQIGNEMMILIGGREIHPINVRVGGVYRAPTKAQLAAKIPDLEWALEASEQTLEWVRGFSIPDFEQDYEFVALHDPDEYAVIGGRFISNRGIDIPTEEWGDVFEEHHIEWSNALHARVKERGSYFVGPMARMALNYEQLHPRARMAAERAGIAGGTTNPYASILVRSVELIHACATALEEIDSYEEPPFAHHAAPVRGGVGHGASEAPRGILYHRYEIADDGSILSAKIVPPTSQNQARIEQDLRAYVLASLHLDDDALQWQLEQAIRNYDPCISCATHFLDLRVERR